MVSVDKPTVQPGPLRSELLRVNKRLQDCAQFDRFHVQPDEPPSDHVKRIQDALRQVDDATIPDSETNYGDATTKAVVAFKTSRNLFTRGTTTVDPIVGTGTIAKLDELLKADDDLKRGRGGGGGELGLSATIVPDTFIAGEANFAGFSAARLSHQPNADWNRRDPLKPISQFVPVGQTRKLLVKGIGDASVGFSIDSEQFAAISDQDSAGVTISGRAEGRALLTVAVENNRPVRVEIVVRAAKSLLLDVFHLGPPAVPGAAQTFQAGILPGLTKVYSAQSNISFAAGATRDITTMIMDGASTAIDTSLPLFFASQSGPPRANHPTLRFGDLQREVKNPKAVTLFVSPNIKDEESPNIAGRGFFGTRLCWFKLGLQLNANSLTLPSHEVGHSLGLHHIDVPRNETFLMHPTIQINNIIIPSETLEDLVSL